MRLTILTFLLFSLFFLFASPAYAIYDPLSVTNNKFGVHIADPVDLPDAAGLVNSSGGDWGYVTFVIQKGERNIERWQKVFDSARRLHLIPLVRVATAVSGDKWEKPNLGEVDGWVSFLNSLNWVIKNRYVIVANEPNQSLEWGGEINPEEYATYLKIFSEKLKAKSEDFFVLPAGLDASAPNGKTTMDEKQFLARMREKEPDVFNKIDGWTSHSYPNPAFSGSENDSGKGTVRTFDWELSYLKSLGVDKNLPVFITETGWAHQVDGQTAKLLSIDKIGQKMVAAFQTAWNDNRVVAVTPFILKYDSPPFDIFSWKDRSGNFYGFYNDIQKLQKTAGTPVQEFKGNIIALFIPPLHFPGGEFTGLAYVGNTGQAVWSPDTVFLNVQGSGTISLVHAQVPAIAPGEQGVVTFKMKTPDKGGFYTGNMVLQTKDKVISNQSDFEFFVISQIRMQLSLWFGKVLQLLKLQ